MTTADLQFSIAADHPCLAGHFPGRPIVPAVVLLDQILNLAREQFAGLGPLRAVSMAKFMQPVLPEQRVTVSLELRDGGTMVEFRCQNTIGTVAQGRFKVDIQP